VLVAAVVKEDGHGRARAAGSAESCSERSIAGITVVHVCFGACGYLAYGDATRDIITLNQPRTWSTAALVLTFPVMMRPINEIVEARLLSPGGWMRRNEAPSQWRRRPRSRGAVGDDRVLRAGVRGVRVLRREARCARRSPSCRPRSSASASWRPCKRSVDCLTRPFSAD
jgi:hypothetical protein